MVMIAIPILTSKAESDRAGESGVGRHKSTKSTVNPADRHAKLDISGKLAHRVLHNSKESADRGSRRHGKADDCVQGTPTHTRSTH